MFRLHGILRLRRERSEGVPEASRGSVAERRWSPVGRFRELYPRFGSRWNGVHSRPPIASRVPPDPGGADGPFAGGRAGGGRTTTKRRGGGRRMDGGDVGGCTEGATGNSETGTG